MSRRSQLSSFFILFFLVIFPVYSQTPTNPNAFFEQKEGKWLITFSIGDGVPPEPALALRNTLRDIFTSPKGGSYQHIMDYADSGDNAIQITREFFFKQFQALKEQIAAFRLTHPSTPPKIVIGLTGHGMTEHEKDYVLGLSDGPVTVKELIMNIVGLNADELMVIMQSCQSGVITDLPFRHLVKNVVEDLTKQSQINRSKVVVVTPVSERINSPFFTWEEILRRASESPKLDINGDGVITYLEWKSRVLQLSYEHPKYMPEEVIVRPSGSREIPTDGIDPQFYEIGIEKSTPLFLTDKGLTLLAQRKLEITKLEQYLRDLEEQTHQVQREAVLAIRALLKTPPEKLMEFIRTHHGIARRRALVALSISGISLNSNDGKFLTTLLLEDNDEQLREILTDVLSFQIKDFIAQNVISDAELKQIIQLKAPESPTLGRKHLEFLRKIAQGKKFSTEIFNILWEKATPRFPTKVRDHALRQLGILSDDLEKTQQDLLADFARNILRTEYDLEITHAALSLYVIQINRKGSVGDLESVNLGLDILYNQMMYLANLKILDLALGDDHEKKYVSPYRDILEKFEDIVSMTMNLVSNQLSGFTPTQLEAFSTKLSQMINEETDLKIRDSFVKILRSLGALDEILNRILGIAPQVSCPELLL